jgi:uncharacterized Zn-finger protein
MNFRIENYYDFDYQGEKMISSETLFNNIDMNPKNGKYLCDICENEYATYAGLYSHKRKHDPSYIRKFSCSLCDYSHDNNRHLLDHIEVHARRNQVAMIITNQRTLYRKSNVYKKVYAQDNDNFICTICSKKYMYRQSLQVHMKEHQDNRVFRFNCKECNFKSDHKGHFGRHTKSHENPY